jgi:energy-coupling factor transport system permease protein
MSRRALHPLAWWLWALSLGAAALRTTNPLLLGLLVASAWLVVVARRPEAPWARSFRAFVWLGAIVIVLRVVLQILFGTRLPGDTVFTLPHVDLPSWAAGVTLGGPVTKEALVSSFAEGLQLASMLACIGAANSLASPYRLLRAVPSVLYELGVVVTVAMSFAPQATVNAQRVREARRLRGRPSRGLAGVRGLAIPVLEGALDRSLDLAASMDSRGYGRRGRVPGSRRRVSSLTTLAGVGALMIGMFSVLSAGATPLLGAPMLMLGSALCATSFAIARSGAYRSKYRPDPWQLPELVTIASGVAALVAIVVGGHVDVLSVRPAYSPLVAPVLPLLPTLGILAAALPAFVTPPVPTYAPAPAA